MRWQFANWFGLGLGLAAVGMGLVTSLFVTAEPHAALRVIAKSVGLEEDQARDYRLVVRAVTNRLAQTGDGQQTSEIAQAQIAQAMALAQAARRDAEAAKSRIQELEAQLQAARQAAPRVSGAFALASSGPGPASGLRACSANGAPLRCTLRFEPGSAGLDYTDRARLAALVEAVRASNLRMANIEITGRSDRPGRGQPLAVDCDSPADPAADLACRRAATVAIELGDSLRQGAGLSTSPLVRAIVVPTRGPSPSNRRVDIVISAQ
jgi:hypothetical protein